MDFLIGDLREIVGRAQAVSVLNPRFQAYKLVEFGGKKYVAGLGPPANGALLETLEKPSLLLALVSLVKGDLPRFFKSSSPAGRKEIERAIPEKRVLRFCQKYGMPYDEAGPADFYPSVEDLLIEHFGSRPEAAFELDHFRYRVFWLTYYFRLWQALVMPDLAGSIGIISDFMARYERYDERLKTLQEAEKEQAAKKWLARELALKTKEVRIIPVYDSDNDRFMVTIRAKDLFSAAYFQFCTLLTVPLGEVKAHLKVCANPRCDAWFWGHKNRKVCYLCTRQAVHSQKKRREAQTDGRLG